MEPFLAEKWRNDLWMKTRIKRLERKLDKWKKVIVVDDSGKCK
jgi:hypothetical protein